MNKVTMTVSLRIESSLDSSELECALDRLMETLVDLTESSPHVNDPSMGADFAERKVEISLTASGETDGMAIDSMSQVIRQAIDEHGIDCRQIDSTFVAA